MDGRIAQRELRDDVVAHTSRGGGGEGEHRDLGMAPSQPGELTVFRSKVMSPFRYAVRLIDDERVDADARIQTLQRTFEKFLQQKPLGREVEELVFAAQERRRSPLGSRQRRDWN